MLSFDPETQKATKCHLCGGRPKCVEACPAGSLSYVSWRDLTGVVPPRIEAAGLAPERALACNACHVPGQKASLRDAFGMLFGKGRASGEVSGSRWIDVVGAIAVPVAVVGVVIHGILHRAVKK
jgi:hypothetical protein